MRNSETKNKPVKLYHYDRIQMAVPRMLHRHLKKLAFMHEYDTLTQFHEKVVNAGLRALNLPEYNTKSVTNSRR